MIEGVVSRGLNKGMARIRGDIGKELRYIAEGNPQVQRGRAHRERKSPTDSVSDPDSGIEESMTNRAVGRYLRAGELGKGKGR